MIHGVILCNSPGMFYHNTLDSGLAECAHISLQLVNASLPVTTGWEESRRIDVLRVGSGEREREARGGGTGGQEIKV